MYTFPLFVIGILEKQQKGDMGANIPSLDVCSKESVVPLVSDAMRVNHCKALFLAVCFPDFAKLSQEV